MPSPFPGMDPYLENSAIFPDFHNSFAGRIRDDLNRSLPRPYYAQLDARQELGIGLELRPRISKPDVAVLQDPWSAPAGGTATLVETEVRQEVSPSIELNFDIEPLDASFVEIRDAESGHELITLIELLSPSNKVAGRDRQEYLAKREQILHSRTSLIEIDLLRIGERAAHEPRYQESLLREVPTCPYLVAINRSWRRTALAERAYQIFPIALRGPLPVIPVPLREGEAEPTLDLQYLFRQTYDTGPYARGRVDYDQPPPAPALSPEDLAWVRACVTAHGNAS
jgi:hypothetical protein